MPRPVASTPLSDRALRPRFPNPRPPNPRPPTPLPTRPVIETTYSLYLETDLNRVFGHALAEVAATELRIVADRILAGRLGPIEGLEAGRARLLRFPAEGPTELLATMVGQLSASAALFRHHPGDRPLLEPVPMNERLVYGTELATTQRYRGKTNERLTRAMLNIALATAGHHPSVSVDRPTTTGPQSARPTVLDPMCGRGTTLNWALAYGLDALGIEIDRSAVDQHRIFIETWAKRQRLPHKSTRHRSGNAEQRWSSLRVAPDRPSLKAGRGQRLETFNGDAADLDLPIGRGSIDAIVVDLPYGVQHHSRPGGRPDPDRAGPLALLERCLPVWARWLRPGGSLCLAWNLKRADRRSVRRVVGAAGFEPVVAEGGHSMRHVVDATIERDVMAATRT